jgi:CheY-like chemotaxis protein
LKILLVDDNDELRALSREVLEGLGFQVVDAVDGRNAIRLVRQEPDGFALAFLDFNMPGMNGIETLRVLQKLHPNLPAILCSGTSQEECFRECGIEGLVYLEKPFKLGQLEEALAQVLCERPPEMAS